MKTLIVYYSFTRNNEILAKYLRKKLHCDIFKIEEVKRRTGFTILLDLVFNRTPALQDYHLLLNDYTNLIFIAPVWAGRIASPLKSFLLRERDRINKFSFITLCGGREAQKDKITREITNLVKVEPDNVVELWINDLLPPEKKNTIKHTSEYRIEESELELFSHKINDFLRIEEQLVDY